MASIKDDNGKDIVTYTIDAETLYNVLQYLAYRPYSEVHNHVSNIQLKSVPNYAETETVSDTRTVEPTEA